MPFEVPKEKQIRLIINTDAKCEADDQYAIVHAILSPRLQIKGIIGAHFGTRSATAMEESYEEILHVLDLMGMRGKLNVLRGATYKIPDKNTPVPHSRGLLCKIGSIRTDTDRRFNKSRVCTING
jgi:inosine-uridine nucleoside N-ribohydrolase